MPDDPALDAPDKELESSSKDDVSQDVPHGRPRRPLREIFPLDYVIFSGEIGQRNLIPVDPVIKESSESFKKHAIDYGMDLLSAESYLKELFISTQSHYNTHGLDAALDLYHHAIRDASELLLRQFMIDEYKKKFASSINQRLKDIDAYAAEYPGKAVSGLILELIPEIKSLDGYAGKPVPSVKPLPERATELYKVRTDTSEDGPAFYNRVYKDHIGNGLTRAVLDKLDHPLVARIDALKRKGDAAALALDLPTAWVAPQQWAKRVLAGEETLPAVADASTLSRHAARLTRERKRQSEPRK